MKKNYLLATALAALVSCSSDEYVGDNADIGQNNAIKFDGGAGRLTRATSNTGTVAEMLDGQMKIYGVKMTTTGPAYSDVFDNYILWSNTTNVTTSNPDATTVTAAENGWEYVGPEGTAYGTVPTNGTLASEQYIKYWDYATDEYHFVAGSPVTNFTYNITNHQIISATVSGIAGHINPNTTGTGITTNPVYVAAPVKKLKDNGSGSDYNTDVVFNFTRQQAYVRVGVFETIPGYNITSISFYEWIKADGSNPAAWKSTAEGNNHIILNSKTEGYFSGATDATATVTYNWTTTPASITSTTYASGVTSQESWYGGKLTSGVPAISSTGTVAQLYGSGDDDMNTTTGYFTVLPMASDVTAQPFIVKCDYTLKALGSSNEEINVKGATAAIPAAFCKWNPNTSYTYLFKISDNTNGTTGIVGTDPEGLFPITFDAVVMAEAEGAKQGIITTVSTPSITTYQEGSVTDAGIQYTYNSSSPKPIYFTAQNDETGVPYTLTTGVNAVSNVQVYKLDGAKTEADLILTAPTTTFTTTIVGSATEVGKWTIPENSGSFTPNATGYYAIQYQTATSPAAYAYKVIEVVAAPVTP